MAKNEKRDKKVKKTDKKSLGQRFRSWFKGITGELKKVSWPEKGKFKSNVAAVVVIIVFAVTTIFVFDAVVSALLNVTGFYEGSTRGPMTTPIQAEMDDLLEDAQKAADEAGQEADTADKAEDSELESEEADATTEETTEA